MLSTGHVTLINSNALSKVPEQLEKSSGQIRPFGCVCPSVSVCGPYGFASQCDTLWHNLPPYESPHPARPGTRPGGRSRSSGTRARPGPPTASRCSRARWARGWPRRRASRRTVRVPADMRSTIFRFRSSNIDVNNSSTKQHRGAHLRVAAPGDQRERDHHPLRGAGFPGGHGFLEGQSWFFDGRAECLLDSIGKLTEGRVSPKAWRYKAGSLTPFKGFTQKTKRAR